MFFQAAIEDSGNAPDQDVFVLAGIFAILIAFVTLSTQAIKAALANPVEALRTE